jgi:hypothetical protein
MSTVRLKGSKSSMPQHLRIGRPLAAMAKGGLLVTPHVRQYFREFNGEITLTAPVAELLVSLLTTPPRERSGSFSPSARGNCPRAQALGFLGAPQTALSAETYNLFADGRFRHLRWQAVGLASGFLDEIEVSVPMPALNALGAVDGVNTTEGFGFELKGTSMPLGIMVTAFQSVQQALDDHVVPVRIRASGGRGSKGNWHIGTMWKHVQQVYSYMGQLQANGYAIDRFALVYEHKETQHWEEFVLHANPWMEDRCKAELELLDRTVKLRKLPMILDECRVTPEAKCPYAAICHDPYSHLPEKWQDYMNKDVRRVATRKGPSLSSNSHEPRTTERRVRRFGPEPF